MQYVETESSTISTFRLKIAWIQYFDAFLSIFQASSSRVPYAKTESTALPNVSS